MNNRRKLLTSFLVTPFLSCFEKDVKKISTDREQLGEEIHSVGNDRYHLQKKASETSNNN